MNSLLLSIYRVLLIPFVVLGLPVLALFKRKFRIGLQLRRKRVVALPVFSATQPVWIHAASGEFEYAKSVIRELKQGYPDIPIVVTYFSPTYAQAAANFPGVDQALALPLDLPGPCRNFLAQFRPRVLLIARTDLWPEILASCRAQNIPVVLFSFTQKPFRSIFKKVYMRWMLHWVGRVYCVSPADLRNLSTLSLKVPVSAMGDTRFDQVHYRLSHPRPLPAGISPLANDLPILVAGSTWPQDEAVLLPALSTALHNNKLRLILVPHEPDPEHLERIEASLKPLCLTSYRLSSPQTWADQHVLIVDQVGILADLYTLATFAFVGGSFRGSVHSVMEALGAGCITYVGPFHENNREAMEFSQLQLPSGPGLEVVHGPDELKNKLALALSTPAQLSIRRAQLKEEFNKRLGASAKLINELGPYLTI